MLHATQEAQNADAVIKTTKINSVSSQHSMFFQRSLKKYRMHEDGFRTTAPPLSKELCRRDLDPDMCPIGRSLWEFRASLHPENVPLFQSDQLILPGQSRLSSYGLRVDGPRPPLHLRDDRNPLFLLAFRAGGFAIVPADREYGYDRFSPYLRD